MFRKNPDAPEGRERAAHEHTRPGRVYRPQVDIVETDSDLWVRADLPGVDEKAVHVALEDGVLAIRGEVSLTPYEKLVPVYTEFEVGNFEQSFRLSNRIDGARIQARLRDGVLELQLPKIAEAQPRQIEIRGS